MIRRLLAIVATALMLAAVPARADEVRLKNGDRLTGDVTSLTGGTLVFKTAVGEVKIPWGDVTSLAVDNAIYVTVASNPPILTTFDAADPNGYVTLMPGGPVLLSEITVLSLRNSRWEMSGGAGAGLVQTAGNTEVSNVRLSADATAKHGSDRFAFTAAGTRAKDRGVESARNWSATGKYDRFLTSRLFANANAVFTNDRFRDIDLRTALGAGLGLQLIDNARVKLSGSGGVGWVSENFISIADDSYEAAFENGALTIALVPSRVELFHSHDGYFQISQGDKKFLRMQNGIRLSLVAGFVTTLQQDLDYDHRPSPGRKQTDSAVSLTLGYRF
jgi:putative salt-induced outer membrane protein YdiY